LTVTPPKVAGLTIISRESADDSNSAAAQVVGDGLARDIARRIYQAVFAGLASPAPAGLTTLSGVQTYVNANASRTWTSPRRPSPGPRRWARPSRRPSTAPPPRSR
jgi:HK97 family phage major capsid protein